MLVLSKLKIKLTLEFHNIPRQKYLATVLKNLFDHKIWHTSTHLSISKYYFYILDIYFTKNVTLSVSVIFK